jgi:hypothetical protein
VRKMLKIGKNILWIRSSKFVSVNIIKLHTIEAYSASEITQVNYSFRSLSRKENENV